MKPILEASEKTNVNSLEMQEQSEEGYKKNQFLGFFAMIGMSGLKW
jgi:hypothetical protein